MSSEHKTCRYISPEGVRCQEPLHNHNNEHCFWHDTKADKSGSDIKEKLEAFARTGKPMTGFQLKHADLYDINLVNKKSDAGYDLRHANMDHCNLKLAHMFSINLYGTSLLKANLSGANLHYADLRRCNLLGINLFNTKIENTRFGKSILQEEDAKKSINNATQLYEEAEEIYRNIRKAFEYKGLFEYAGHFFYKEMIMRRMQMPLFSYNRFFSRIVDLFSGYGENPVRVIIFSLALIFVFAIAYFILGVKLGDEIIAINTSQTFSVNVYHFLQSLYFSVVTFTTLGYGDIVPIGLSRLLSAIEAFTGSFTIALFVVVFVKKMTR